MNQDGNPPGNEAYKMAENLPGDFTCANCGYSLRGLATDSICPECAWPVLRSFGVNGTAAIHPSWAAQVRLGFGLQLAVIALAIVSVVTESFLARWAVVARAIEVFRMTAQCLWILGIIAVTTREPRFGAHEPFSQLRKSVRVFAIFAYGGYLIQQIASGMIGVALPGVSAVFALVGILALITELLYCQRLATRVGAPLLRGFAAGVLWLVVFGASFSLGYLLLEALIRSNVGPGVPSSEKTGLARLSPVVASTLKLVVTVFVAFSVLTGSLLTIAYFRVFDQVARRATREWGMTA